MVGQKFSKFNRNISESGNEILKHIFLIWFFFLLEREFIEVSVWTDAKPLNLHVHVYKF